MLPDGVKPFDFKSDLVASNCRWTNLSSDDDQREFLRLRGTFRGQSPAHVRDRRTVSFSQELVTLLQFIERSPIGCEERSLLVGVAFAGPFVCVNTRQLKTLIGRCKSSINGSFHQLGYYSVKAKANNCLLSILPSLVKEAALMRQWTVRCASEESPFSFVTSYRRGPILPVEKLPTVNETPKSVMAEIPHVMRPIPLPIIAPRAPPVDEPPLKFEERSDFWETGTEGAFGDRYWETGTVTRSQSAAPSMFLDWLM
jgi:hypothetical protein